MSAGADPGHPSPVDPTRLAVHRVDADRRADFHAVHAGEDGWCACVAWWVPTWDGWMDRSAEENRALRDSLFDRGEYDGYLLYLDGHPVGWCQVGPRDRLEKLRTQLALAPDPRAWAITCFLITGRERRRGLAAHLLREVLTDLARRGVGRVEAYPRADDPGDPGELWTGPRAMYRAAGFRPEGGDARRTILVWTPPEPRGG